jgi:hypothetical protein
MATTTNYGWSTPDDSALVKDGASAIRTLGSSVDTTVKALSPGTTAGDIDYYTSSTAKSRIAIGSSGQVLTVSGGVPAWATASSGGGTNWSLLNAGGTSLTAATTITVSGISGKDKIAIFIESGSSASAASDFYYRINGDTGSNYTYSGVRFDIDSTTFTATKITGEGSFGTIYFPAGSMSNAAASAVSSGLILTGGNSSGVKMVTVHGSGNPSGSSGQDGYSYHGFWSGSATVSSVSITSSSGNFDSGKIYVYTSA